MKRVFSATCIAAMFAVGLAAQSTGTAGTTGQDPQAAGGGQGRGGGPRTVTGCLRAGDTAGTYMLTDIVMNAPAAAGATTTGDPTTGTTGTTGATTTGTATTGGGQGQGGAPMSAMLVPDPSIDLKPHVGHKIEVTGSLVGGRRGGGGGDAAATGTGTATGSTTTGGAGTATGTGTGTGSTSGTGTTGATTTAQGRGGMRNMSVTAVRMVSESCS